MRTVLRNSSRLTLRLFSRPRHASGPLLRPYSRRSLLRSQSRRSQTTVKPIFAHPRTSRGRRSSQYHIEYIFPRPSQAYALWYRSSRRIVFSTLEERRSHWLTQVRRRRLSDIEKRYDVFSGRYFRSDIETIRRVENNINGQLNLECYASLNEFYNGLGIPPIAAGELVGWSEPNSLSVEFGSQLTEKGEPVLTVDFLVSPKENYFKIN